jgi:hypothetical protein
VGEGGASGGKLMPEGEIAPGGGFEDGFCLAVASKG